MFYTITRSRSSSHAPVSARRRSSTWLVVLVLVQEALLELRFPILNERTRHRMVQRAFWYSMREGAIRRHDWGSIWYAGVRHRIGIDLIVLRRQVLIGVIVARHVFEALKETM